MGTQQFLHVGDALHHHLFGTVAEALSGQRGQLDAVMQVIRPRDHSRATVARDSEVHQWNVFCRRRDVALSGELGQVLSGLRRDPRDVSADRFGWMFAG